MGHLTQGTSDQGGDASGTLRSLAASLRGKGALIAICGADGTGKTTVAKTLCQNLASEGVDVRIIHSYVWVRNFFVMPFLLSRLRKGGQVVILDRALWDNVIVILSRLNVPLIFKTLALRLVGLVPPKFDHRICLSAPLDVVCKRRPEEPKRFTARKLNNYALMCDIANFRQIDTSTSITNQVVNTMALNEGIAPKTGTQDTGYRKNWNPNDWYQDIAIAEDYDRTRFSSLAGKTFDALEKRALRKILTGLPTGATIIDAPCGTGRLAETLLELGYRVIGIDISAPMLDVASRKLKRFGDRFQAHVMDIKDIRPEDFNADAVLCARVLMHFPLAEQIDFLKKVASLTEGPVIFNQSVFTPWHRLRRTLKRVLRNQSPASYPLMTDEVKQLIEGSGLTVMEKRSVQALLSEAVFWNCQR